MVFDQRRFALQFQLRLDYKEKKSMFSLELAMRLKEDDEEQAKVSGERSIV